MEADKVFCMSSYLAFRFIVDKEKVFKEGLEHIDFSPMDEEKQIACDSPKEIEERIKSQLAEKELSNAAILLSGGMDSAILASYMPEGTKAYTARCDACGAIDETERARRYCEEYGLEHHIIDITWQDYLDSIDELMLNDGCPVSSNEPQVYKLAKCIQEDGCDLVIIGDNADAAFGVYDELCCKDWEYQEWVERFTYLKPDRVLKEYVPMEFVFEKYRLPNGKVDFIRCIKNEMAVTSSGAYFNAFRNAGLEYLDPYACMKMSKPLDLARVRRGDSKYHIRELFRERYPDLEVPEKIAMPRAVDQWMAEWGGGRAEVNLNRAA